MGPLKGKACDVGILFGDVVGSTRLYETLGDRAALTAIEAALGLMRGVVEQQGGRVVKTIGDELMAAFPAPPSVFDAAIEMQRRIETAAPVCAEGTQTRIRIRIGFSFGPALTEEDDFFGDTVNVAARMAGLANGGQIITTADLAALLSQERRALTRPLDLVSVRGKAEPMGIVDVVWKPTRDLTVLPEQFGLAGAAPSRERLALSYAGDTHAFEADHGPIGIGREPDNVLVVNDGRASRRHATIERRRGNWVLHDHSSNGTFVSVPGGRQIELRRQEFILHGQGSIRLGHRDGTEETALLRFSVDG